MVTSIPRRRFLVMARAGENSLHPHWLKGADRNFDLYLSYYGNQPGKYAADADHWREMKSTKWPALHEHIASERALIESYEAVWFPDDDLLIDTAGINRMFDLFVGLGLSLAQPSLSHDSHFSHAAVLQHPDYLYRLNNFVEVMGPIFSREALRLLHPTFEQSKTGWGLDYLWLDLLDRAGHGNRIGILDAVTMTHTRPVGGGDIYQGKESPGVMDVAHLRSLYPDADLKTRSRRAKFGIFGGAKIVGPRSTLLARILGRAFCRWAKSKARRTPKFRRD